MFAAGDNEHLTELHGRKFLNIKKLRERGDSGRQLLFQEIEHVIFGVDSPIITYT